MIISDYAKLLTHDESIMRELARYLIESSLPYQLSFDRVTMYAPDIGRIIDIGTIDLFSIKLKDSAISWGIKHNTIYIFSLNGEVIASFKDVTKAFNFKLPQRKLSLCERIYNFFHRHK